MSREEIIARKEHISIDSKSKVISSAARKRWKLLARSLVKQKVTEVKKQCQCPEDEVNVSVRRFKGFELFRYEKLTEDDEGIWFRLKNKELLKQDISVRLLKAKFTPETLIGFNNTGNVCVWPAEEILASFCLKHKEKFRAKTICELGGGMTALAGLLLAANSSAEEVYLTDGNIESVSNIQEIMKKNEGLTMANKIPVRQLLWGKDAMPNDIGKFDYVICADCLYFIECHLDLIDTILRLLEDKGEAILFAPKRGSTFDAFIDLAKSHFEVTITENYDEEIWQKHLIFEKAQKEYEADIHYPFMINLKKKERNAELKPDCQFTDEKS